MDVQSSPPRVRQQPGRPPAKLPQPPRRREEFAASSRLAGAGSRIAGRNASAPPPGGGSNLASPRTPRKLAPPQQRPPPRQNSLEPSSQPNSARRRVSTTASSSPSEQTGIDRASALEEVVSGDVSEDQRVTPREVETQSNEIDNVGGQQHVDAMELARGGEALLRRLADLNNANVDLRRQLENQVKEVSTLTEAGYSQQQLLREFERQADQARQSDASAVEARVRAEVAENEVRLQALLDEAKEKAVRAEAEFLERQREIDGQRRHVEGERDEARERLREVEARLEAAVNAPEAQETRAKALEMELNLLRSRFARETEAKKAAERASAESKAQQQELKACLEREVAQVRKLRKALDEQTELAAFRQEVVNDLQSRLKDQKSEAENKLRREKGKLEAVNRLEGILPKHMLLQALA